jgi:hypothetical protein
LDQSVRRKTLPNWLVSMIKAVWGEEMQAVAYDADPVHIFAIASLNLYTTVVIPITLYILDCSNSSSWLVVSLSYLIVMP